MSNSLDAAKAIKEAPVANDAATPVHKGPKHFGHAAPHDQRTTHEHQVSGALDWSSLNSSHAGSSVHTAEREAQHGELPDASTIDPNTIRGSVLTKDGWLVSERHHDRHIMNERYLVQLPEKASK